MTQPNTPAHRRPGAQPFSVGGGAPHPTRRALLAGLGAALALHHNAWAQKGTPAQWLGRSHRVRDGETLPEIGRANGLGWVEMMAANQGIDLWTPGIGRVLRLPVMHPAPPGIGPGITVNLGDFRLYLSGPDLPSLSFPIGIGREGLETPISNHFSIARKQADPIWVPTPRMRAERPDLPEQVPPGPDNPLGSHALYLDRGLIRIHGTNRPWGVGARVSSGCIRLYPEDIRLLFDVVPVGTPVRILYQPVKTAVQDDGIYLDVHPDGDQADAVELGDDPPRRLPDGLAGAVLRAGEVAWPDSRLMLDWQAVRRAGLERSGVPVLVGQRL